MLIVCTKDPILVRTAQDPRSGAGQWGTLVIINPRFNQAQATDAIADALRGRNEPVCFAAHGNDYEIGDPGSGPNDWSWTRAQLALILQNAYPNRFGGPILIHACAENVSNFSAGLVVALETIRALAGVWIYGYQKAVPVTSGFPNPATMDRNRELYGTRVSYRPDGAAAEDTTANDGAHAPAAGYRASFPSGYSVEVPLGFDPDEVRRLLGLMAESPLR
jgi:hypothetical protein